LSWLNENDGENESKEIMKVLKGICTGYYLIRAELDEEDEKCGRYNILKEKYAEYIEPLLGDRSSLRLGLLDLEILKNIFTFQIHVFDEPVSLSSFRYKETLNLANTIEEHSILYKSKGRWKKLEPNRNLNRFCKAFTPESNKVSETSFDELKKWIDDENNKITEKNCIDKLNPKCKKTPDNLYEFIFNWFKSKMYSEEELVQAISLLAKWVAYP
jgi:hypothetical protein